MQIITYPHPTLRHKSLPVTRVDADLRKIVEEMFELMYEAKGVGLAANQVDLPLRFFILNLAAKKGEGEERVFINPVVSKPKGLTEQEEGCLSLPGVYGFVKRPERVQLEAYTLDGEQINLELDDLFARVVQHELDHLDGVVFTDRLSSTGAMAVKDILGEFELEYKNRLQSGEQLSEDDVAARIKEYESKYCSE